MNVVPLFLLLKGSISSEIWERIVWFSLQMMLLQLTYWKRCWWIFSEILHFIYFIQRVRNSKECISSNENKTSEEYVIRSCFLIKKKNKHWYAELCPKWRSVKNKRLNILELNRHHTTHLQTYLQILFFNLLKNKF